MDSVIETFYGHIKTIQDAEICLEACIHGSLPLITRMPVVLSGLCIRSGSRNRADNKRCTAPKHVASENSVFTARNLRKEQLLYDIESSKRYGTSTQWVCKEDYNTCWKW
ncbi:hypothetical protein HDU77_003262 [Chytriomyces hyalinus]|nr:hypothetical protein HDU77_003262 [Chytriomyces hyalinus]